MVVLLLELGADPNVRDVTYDGTPLDWAAYNGQAVVVEHLLRRGPSPPDTGRRTLTEYQ